MLAQNDSAPEKVRIPLDHNETDALDLRIRALIFSGRLSEAEHGRLIKNSRDLRKADRLLARILYGKSLPATELRPLFYDYGGPLLDASQVEIASGWVARLREFVEKLEGKYFTRLVPTSSAAAEDDI